MSMKSYWIFPSGKIQNLYDDYHIEAVIKNPKNVGLSMTDIEKIYEKYNEKIGIEGKASNEILDSLAKKGFIRIRSFDGGYTYSISVWKINSKIKRNLSKWAEDFRNRKGITVKITELFSFRFLPEISLDDIYYEQIDEMKRKSYKEFLYESFDTKPANWTKLPLRKNKKDKFVHFYSFYIPENSTN